MGKSFRHNAGFGKRIEFWIIGLMMKEGLDVYIPLVDDHAVDAIVKRADGTIAQVQIKAQSNDVKEGSSALFAAIPHELRKGYWFVFYSERLDRILIMTSKEFIKEARQNKNGKNKGKRSIWFNGTRRSKETGKREEYIKERYQRYVAKDFGRIVNP